MTKFRNYKETSIELTIENGNIISTAWLHLIKWAIIYYPHVVEGMLRFNNDIVIINNTSMSMSVY